MRLPAKVQHALGDLPTADDYLPGHGDPAWSATHYDLELDYQVADNRLQGTATIEVVAESTLERLVLDLAHLDVSKVAVDGRAPERWKQRAGRLVVDLAEPLAQGASASVRVAYRGRPRVLVERHHGDAGWEELGDGVIVAGQPHGAPTWFPCNDRPDDKATYRIAVTVPQGYTVVANGTRTSRTRRSSRTTWVHELDRPMATYLATVQVGRYDVRRLKGSDPEVVAVVPEGLTRAQEADFEAAFGDQPAMLTFFSRVFGDYPFDTYSCVVTADELEIPLESQTLSTFGSNFLRDDWDSVRLVAHELAHQWFGNAVTLGAWRDIWLHEGFACYSEWLWSEESGLDTADERARHHHGRLAEQEVDLLLSDPGPELMFDDRTYKRGACTLHALRLVLGDDAFFAMLQRWVEEHRDGTVTTEDFRALAVDVAGSDGEDVDALLTAWLDRTELPDLPSAR